MRDAFEDFLDDVSSSSMELIAKAMGEHIKAYFFSMPRSRHISQELTLKIVAKEEKERLEREERQRWTDKTRDFATK